MNTFLQRKEREIIFRSLPEETADTNLHPVCASLDAFTLRSWLLCNNVLGSTRKRGPIQRARSYAQQPQRGRGYARSVVNTTHRPNPIDASPKTAAPHLLAETTKLYPPPRTLVQRPSGSKCMILYLDLPEL